MKTLTSTLSLVAICAIAAPATADVTAAELWAEWQANAAAAGSPFVAQATTNANGLTLTGIVWTIPATDTEPPVDVMFGDMTLTNESDGSVTITMPETVGMMVDVPGEGAFGANLSMTFADLDFTASGDMSDLSYNFSSSSITAMLDEIIGMPEDFKPEVTVDINIGATTGVFRQFDQGEDRAMESTLSSGPATFLVEVVGPPSEPGTVTMNLEMGASQATASGLNMTMFDNAMLSANPGAYSADSFPSIYSDGTYASLRFDINVDIPGTRFAANGSNDGGRIVSGVGPDGIVFDISDQNFAVSAQGSDLPFPVDVSTSATRMALSFPALAGPDPQDFSVVLDLSDVAMNEQLWSIFDPGQAIPRDPITMQLDIAGLAVMFADLISMDPMQLTGPPGEMRSVTLNNLNVSAGGAQLTGAGAAEFAPGQFPPMPVGQVDLSLSGLNGLMSALTAAGLLPQEQAMMAQAMMGMFARPGAGPDTLESTIEFLPGGGITANGVPLQ